MAIRLAIGLIVAVSVFVGVGSAAADSAVTNYGDGASSLMLNLGGGVHAAVHGNDFAPPDFFIHGEDPLANFAGLSLNGFPGFAIALFFEGFTGSGARQYGIYTCVTLSGQTCTVSGTRRGSFFVP
jgi:hypothetical protein